MFDLVIRNGLVIDGQQNPAYKADIGIKNGRIAEISECINEVAGKVIDATGKVVSPGFIDIHCHSDLAPLLSYQPESAVYQGVTFSLCGNCGISIIPSTPQSREVVTKEICSHLQQAKGNLRIDFHSMDDYVSRVESKGDSINYGMLIGHSALRGCVMGYDLREPTEEELDAMKTRLHQELAMGAFGLSLGLIYPPSSCAKLHELEELAKVVRDHNGLLTVHMRNEGPRVFEAVEEVLGIAERTGVHLEISHLKIMSKSLWGHSQRLLDRISDAKKEGVNVTCDQYPFNASSTSLTALVPQWAFDGGVSELLGRVRNPSEELKKSIASEMESRGGAHSVLIATTKGQHPEWEGRTIKNLSDGLELGEVDTVLEVLEKCNCAVSCNFFSQSEEDMLNILRQPDIAVGSDGYNFSYDRTIMTASSPHPRSFCTFPHALELLRDKNLLPIETAVYKMTGLPARNMGMTERGIIAEGKVADIVIFNPKEIGQNGDFLHPFNKPKGIDKVIVSGEITLSNGQITGNHPGRILRHGKC